MVQKLIVVCAGLAFRISLRNLRKHAPQHPSAEALGEDASYCPKTACGAGVTVHWVIADSGTQPGLVSESYIRGHSATGNIFQERGTGRWGLGAVLTATADPSRSLVGLGAGGAAAAGGGVTTDFRQCD